MDGEEGEDKSDIRSRARKLLLSPANQWATAAEYIKRLGFITDEKFSRPTLPNETTVKDAFDGLLDDDAEVRNKDLLSIKKLWGDGKQYGLIFSPAFAHFESLTMDDLEGYQRLEKLSQDEKWDAFPLRQRLQVGYYKALLDEVVKKQVELEKIAEEKKAGPVYLDETKLATKDKGAAYRELGLLSSIRANSKTSADRYQITLLLNAIRKIHPYKAVRDSAY